MAKLTKLVEAASTPGAEHVGRLVETGGKTSALGGVSIYGVEQYVGTGWTLTEYAALVSIVGGLVWISKNLFDMWLAWVKHRRG
tara:strand:+ start:3854 stop:4105 length:252 start_codon:yes stop_codon:yes gene_type:complete